MRFLIFIIVIIVSSIASILFFQGVLMKPLFHTGFGGGFGGGGHSTAPAGLNRGGVVCSFWAS